MKRGLLLLIGAISIGTVACDLDIPSKEVTGLSADALCILSGGEYQEDTGDCVCGIKNPVNCGQKVTCQYDETKQDFGCVGYSYTILPSGPCMMEGIIVCADRINSSGESLGYEIRCQNHEWTEPVDCQRKSCKMYQLENSPIRSSRCGDCLNDNMSCVHGEVQTNNEPPKN